MTTFSVLQLEKLTGKGRTSCRSWRIRGNCSLGSGSAAQRLWWGPLWFYLPSAYTPSAPQKLKCTVMVTGPGVDSIMWNPDGTGHVAASGQWSISAWAISFSFVRLKKWVFSCIWSAREVTFLSGTLAKSLKFSRWVCRNLGLWVNYVNASFLLQDYWLAYKHGW
jgi:hypothetical protein